MSRIYFCNNIKKYRKMCGYTQKQLANLVGVSKNSISAFENGDYHPSAFVAYVLCEVLNVPFHDLFYIKGEVR